MSVLKELKEVRAEITKYVSVKAGSHDSQLCFKLSSNKEAFRFKYNLDHSDFIKHLEKEYRVKEVSIVDSNYCYLRFQPEVAFFSSKGIKLTLGEFLYITKNDKLTKSFIETHNIVEGSYFVGCNSVGALLRVAIWLKPYKSKFWIEMRKFAF